MTMPAAQRTQHCNGRGEGLRHLSQLRWGRYPIRTCRSLHHCEICEKDITLGERYYDGGYNRRGHVSCVESEKFHEQV